MARKKPDPRRVWLLIGAAAVLLAVTGIFLARGMETRQRYEALLAVTPEPTAAPPTLQVRPTEPMFRIGSIGPEVIEFQKRLAELNYYSGELDGQYYEGTAAAVMVFQAQHGLEADGIAGAITLALLFSPQAQKKLDATPSPTPGSVPSANSPRP